MTRALHRLLRRLLPAGFRRLHGDSMEEVFLEAHREARRVGPGAVWRLWSREVVDLAVTGRRLRAQVRRDESRLEARSTPRRSVTGRPGGGMMGIVDDVRYAVRSLVRRPTVTLFAAATVALGVGATTAIFSTLEGVVLNPLPYDGADRMVSLVRSFGGADGLVTSPTPEQAEQWSARDDLFERTETWTLRGMTLTGQGEARELWSALVRPSFHDFVGRSPVLGRAFAPDELTGEGARVVLISDGLWTSMFARDPGVLGEALTLDGEPFTVVGVMPPRTLMPAFGLQAVDVWRPLDQESARRNNFVTAILQEGVDVGAVNAALAEMPDPGTGRSSGIGTARLVADQVSAGVGETLGLLMGAVLLLLLIACVNVANLLLFRANARRQETAVRSALGGGRGRLVRQLLLESVLLALVGGALGVVLAYVGQDVILELRPERLEVLDHVGINGRVLAFAFLVTLSSGLAFGLVPALQSGRPDALEPLRSGARSEGDVVGRRIRWLLVSGEVALSFALLLGSLSVLAELSEKQRADVGYRSDEVAVMELFIPGWRYATDEERAPVTEALRSRAASLPGAVHVSLAMGVPPRAGVLFGEVHPEGAQPLEGMQTLHGPSVDAAYFQALGQRILAGRGLTEEDLAADDSRIVLGETAAERFFPGEDPVGRRFRMGAESDNWFTVVGVAEDVAMTGLSVATRPLQVYHPLRSVPNDVTVLVRSATGSDPAELLPLLREVALDVDPALRVDRLVVAEDLMRATLDRERFTTTILTTFAVLALLPAAVGLYGVVSQVVGQRTREIGIRIALGARRASIASMVLRRAGGATAAGIAAGVLLALAGTRLMATRFPDAQPPGIGTHSLAAYGVAGVLLAAVALAAALAPARKATRVDPVEAMRAE